MTPSREDNTTVMPGHYSPGCNHQVCVCGKSTPGPREECTCTFHHKLIQMDQCAVHGNPGLREEPHDPGSHACCNSRLEKEGGKARCCSCEPHDGCTLGREEHKHKWNLPEYKGKVWCACGASTVFALEPREEPRTLEAFVEEKDREFDKTFGPQPNQPFYLSPSGDYSDVHFGADELKTFLRSALREVAQLTAYVLDSADLEETQYDKRARAWLGTNDQPHA